MGTLFMFLNLSCIIDKKRNEIECVPIKLLYLNKVGFTSVWKNKIAYMQILSSNHTRSRFVRVNMKPYASQKA